MPRHWTNEEIRILKNGWGNVSFNSIYYRLKRTKTAIRLKAKRLNLGGAISSSYTYITANQASNLLNVDSHKVLNWIYKKRLKAEFKNLSVARKVWCIDYEDFIEFLKENQDKWDSTKVELYALGQEPLWLQEKRKKDRKRKLEKELKDLNILGGKYENRN